MLYELKGHQLFWYKSAVLDFPTFLVNSVHDEYIYYIYSLRVQLLQGVKLEYLAVAWCLSFWIILGGQYPAGKPTATRPSFAELLEKSLCKQEDMRAWCPHCRAYVPLQQVVSCLSVFNFSVLVRQHLQILVVDTVTLPCSNSQFLNLNPALPTLFACLS